MRFFGRTKIGYQLDNRNFTTPQRYDSLYTEFVWLSSLLLMENPPRWAKDKKKRKFLGCEDPVALYLALTEPVLVGTYRSNNKMST